MSDQTARDAIIDAVCANRRTTCSSPCRVCLGEADAVLAVLGIPPDTTTDTIRAGLAALRIAKSATLVLIGTYTEGSAAGTGWAEADFGDRIEGASPAAAVLALAAKVEEQK